MEKFLSIIVPTYNVEQYLGNCLSSLLLPITELLENVEIIVLIDGSKDNSSAIAHSYEDRYPNVFRVIDKENGNYGSCVNRGLKEASGKYFMVLDADDCFDTKAFSSFLEQLLHLDVDLVVTSGMNIYDGGASSYKWKFNYEDKTEYPIENLHEVWIHEVTYRTDCLRRCHYRQTEGISYSDEEFVFYPIFATNNFYALDLPLYRYTVGREGQTIDHGNWLKAVDNDIQVSKRMLGYLDSFDWKKSRAKNYILSKTYSRVRGFYWRALIKCNAYNDLRIAEFDRYLENNCPEYYQDSEQVETPSGKLKFKYVHYWRRNKRHLNPKWNLFVLYQYWLKLRSLK